MVARWRPCGRTRTGSSMPRCPFSSTSWPRGPATWSSSSMTSTGQRPQRSTRRSPCFSATARRESSSSSRPAPTRPWGWPDCVRRETSSRCVPDRCVSTTRSCPASSMGSVSPDCRRSTSTGWPNGPAGGPRRCDSRRSSCLTKDREHFIESFTGGSRQVVDYLTREVLDLLEPRTRDFLLQVSVLDRLNGALCDAVVGISGSGALLADLERSSLFISVDSTGEWFEQHQLFAEALRLELSRTRPELVPVLHSRAARWFESVGDRENATNHAIAARDVALASRLVAGQVQLLASTGRWATIRRWLSQLSWPEAEQDPELAYARAVVGDAGWSHRPGHRPAGHRPDRTTRPAGRRRTAPGFPGRLRGSHRWGQRRLTRRSGRTASSQDRPDGRMAGDRARRARPGAVPAGSHQRRRSDPAPGRGADPGHQPDHACLRRGEPRSRRGGHGRPLPRGSDARPAA